MNLKKLLLKSINSYQSYISPILGSNCRYYPSCSEYTKIEFKFEKNLLRAFFKSSKRILTCNQLFSGGLDFPVVYANIELDFYIKKPPIYYWLVPIDKKRFIVVKAFYG